MEYMYTPFFLNTGHFVITLKQARYIWWLPAMFEMCSVITFGEALYFISHLETRATVTNVKIKAGVDENGISFKRSSVHS